ncbi:MAG: CPBP family intramembrane glutamic endopeptidase [Terriglobales bacterium]
MPFPDKPPSPEHNVSAQSPAHELASPDIAQPLPEPAPPLPWTLYDVLRIVAAAVIAIGLFSILALGIAVQHRGGKVTDLPDLARDARIVVPAQLAAYLVVIAYMVFLLHSRGRTFWREIQWNWPGITWLAYAALGVALAIVVQTGSALLPVPKSLPIDRYFRDMAGAYLMAAFGTTVAPLMEELFFRGFLYPSLARKWGVLASIIVTSAGFALIHTSQLASAWAPLLLLFIVGLVLTSVRARTSSVASSFMMHVGYNTTLFTMLFLASDHFRHLERVS